MTALTDAECAALTDVIAWDLSWGGEGAYGPGTTFEQPDALKSEMMLEDAREVDAL